MKYSVIKAYVDYEKEEKWLNEMSAKGMALIKYSWCRYVFTDTPNNEYSYRIELLENLPSHPESVKYIEFLKESGVECVTTYMRWIYLRKKSSEGVFEVYSDNESKIKHYKKISTFWTTLMCIEFFAAFSNISIGLDHYFENKSRLINLSHTNLILGCILFLIGIMLLSLVLPLRKKIKKLEQERIITE